MFNINFVCNIYSVGYAMVGDWHTSQKYSKPPSPKIQFNIYLWVTIYVSDLQTKMSLLKILQNINLN